MAKRTIPALCLVFFCTIGWVYSEPAIGAESAKSAKGAASANAPAGAGLFSAADSAKDEAAAKTVKVGSLGQIDLHVKDQELSKILQLFSIQSQRNIIVSKAVTGTVTADLYGVDFYDALDAILQPNGYGFREKGNFIHVYTAAEIKALKDADRKTSHQVFRLNYISAADASTFVTPLLSSAGAITLSGPVGAGFQPSVTDGGANSFSHADTIIVRDYPEAIEEIAKVLKELDVRPKQVLVEATVLEAKLDEKNAWGVNLTVLTDFSFAEATNPLSIIDDLTKGAVKGGGEAITSQNIIPGESSIQIGVLDGKNVAAFVEALDKVVDTTVLANPKLLVLNRQKANLLVGSRKGYISTTATQTSSTQTVEFLETGTQLTVRPFVSDEGFIRMEIKPSVSTGEVNVVGTPPITVPNQDTQELTTNVMVRTGQTVILGGLFKETTTVTRKQVPGLGDIPILGLAGKGQSDAVTRDEFIFMITPTIMKDQSLQVAGERVKGDVELARMGAGEGLLPWSRSRMISCQVRDARAALERGDKDKALWSVNLALYLDPTLIEARRIKQEITGQRQSTIEDGVLSDAVNLMIQKQLKDESAAPTASPTSGAPAAPTTPAASASPKASAEPAPQPQATAETPAPSVTLQAEPANAPATQPATADATAAQTPEAAPEASATADAEPASTPQATITPVADVPTSQPASAQVPTP